MKILMYHWGVFNQLDVKAAFEYFGHEVDIYHENVKENNQETGHKEHDMAALQEAFSSYDAVFSLNYFSHLSDACEAVGRKYIAWTVDSPMITMYHQSIFNPCNYIFIFDRFFYYEFKAMGVKNVYYLPLAVNSQRVQEVISAISIEQAELYKSDVSFVGGLYHRNSYDRIRKTLPPYLQGYFEAAMLLQMDIYGENIMDKLFTVDLLSQLSDIIDFKQDDRAFSDIQLVFSSTFLGFKLANMERVRALNELAKNMQVDLYTDEDDANLIGVRNRGCVSYMEDMPKVFHYSKINLNFTIRNIRTGIPLRVWDILGAGGFLLTNYQIELPDYFENGKDLVYFTDIEDCKRKAEYYLRHEEERAAIAANGLAKVQERHSYENRVQEILRLVD